MKEGGEASDKPLDNAVLIRMKQFRAMNKMKKLALKVPQDFQVSMMKRTRLENKIYFYCLSFLVIKFFYL